MSKKTKTKWKLRYWHRDRDCQVTEGFHTFEDLATRRNQLHQSGKGWNFEEIAGVMTPSRGDATKPT